MNNILNRKTIRTYKFFSDRFPKLEIARITIEENLFDKTGKIEIFNEDLTPIVIRLIYKYNNNIVGAESCLEDRAMPPNRMFFEDYCIAHGYNPYNLNDRLKISEGRNCDDDLYLVMEETIIDE